MTKLSKAQIKERDELANRLKDARQKLDAAVDKFNADVMDGYNTMKEAVEAYNEAVGDANGFRNDLATEIQDGIDEKSDKWQESDKGQAVYSWKDEWEGELDLAEIDEPEALELDLEDAADLLEQLPEECGI